MSKASSMKPETTGLLVVDVQEKLLPLIPDRERLLLNLGFLLDAAELMGVMIQATEQYPKGLGSTVPELARRLPHRPEKRRSVVVPFPRCRDASRKRVGRKSFWRESRHMSACNRRPWICSGWASRCSSPPMPWPAAMLWIGNSPCVGLSKPVACLQQRKQRLLNGQAERERIRSACLVGSFKSA